MEVTSARRALPEHAELNEQADVRFVFRHRDSFGSPARRSRGTLPLGGLQRGSAGTLPLCSQRAQGFADRKSVV